MDEFEDGYGRGHELLKRQLIVTGATGELGSGVLRTALVDDSIDLVIATSKTRPIVVSSEKLVKLENVDLSEPLGVAKLTDALTAMGHAKTGLLHCAGSFPGPSAMHRLEVADVASVIEANALSFLGAAKAVIPHMRNVNWGRMIAFTSHTQGAAYPFLGAFNLAKAALLSAVQTLANENARFGIACNAIAVATLKTDIERRIKPNGSYEDWVSVEELSKFAIEIAQSGTSQLNGSEIHFWKYSHSFFEESIFARNSLAYESSDPDSH